MSRDGHTSGASRDSDEFVEVHSKLSAGAFDDVLNTLLDGDQIRAPLRGDANHAWYLVADCYYQTRRYTDAVHAFELALAAWPDDYQALWGLSECYRELGEFDKTLSLLEQAIGIAGPTDSLLFNLANTYLDLGEYERAVECYSQIPRESELADQARVNKDIAERRASPDDDDQNC